MWDQYSGELYARVLELTKEEAQRMVRNEGGGGRCGFWVLRKLVERYAPRTFTKRLKMMMKVLKPREVKGMREVQAAVGEWESQVRRLEEEYRDTIDDSLKVAVLVACLPEELRERVFEMERGGGEVKYGEARDVVIATVVRKARQRKPRENEVLSMEMGGYEDGGGKWSMSEGEGWDREWGVDAVGMGKGNPSVRCHRCGGVGHMARECASPWDMQGSKGEGK